MKSNILVTHKSLQEQGFEYIHSGYYTQEVKNCILTVEKDEVGYKMLIITGYQDDIETATVVTVRDVRANRQLQFIIALVANYTQI